ncbi:MAG TPA: fimbria/pilus periplasmic chaperone [Rhizomicrobium sp.]
MIGRGAIFAAALLLGVLPALADPPAASFEVAPTTIDLVPGTPGLFYIANRGEAPVSIQIQTMDWHQTGNADSLAPSETLYASPPLVNVAPAERQTVRLLADPAEPSRESEYRLIVSQLSQGAMNGTAVRVLLQFSIPVFVSANKATPPDVVWSAACHDGILEISARNDGGDALKLTGMRVSAADEKPVPVTNGLAYVLPGATRSWRIASTGTSTASVHLTTHDERSGVTLDTDIVLQR